MAPTLEDPPDDLPEAERDAWVALNALILESWRTADVDRGTLWYTVVGRQGPPVILVGALDKEPNRALARPPGDAGRRVMSQSGNAMFIRSAPGGEVRLITSSGISTPDARRRVAAELERLGYFAGCTLKF